MFSAKALTTAISGVFGERDRLSDSAILSIAPAIVAGARGEFQIFDNPLADPTKDPNFGRPRGEMDAYDVGSFKLTNIFVETNRYAAPVVEIAQSQLDAVQSANAGLNLARRVVEDVEDYLYGQLSYAFATHAVTLTAAKSGATLDLTDPTTDLLGFLLDAQLECQLAGGAKPDTLLVNPIMVRYMIALDQIRTTSAIAGVASGGTVARMGYAVPANLEGALASLGVKLVVDERILGNGPASSTMVFAAAENPRKQALGVFTRPGAGAGNNLIRTSTVPLGHLQPEGLAVRGDMFVGLKTIQANSARKINVDVTP